MNFIFNDQEFRIEFFYSVGSSDPTKAIEKGKKCFLGSDVHKKKIFTTCKILKAKEVKDDKMVYEVVASGHVAKHVNDKFNKVVGRKAALAKAVKEAKKQFANTAEGFSFAETLWDSFLSKHRY